MPQVYDKTDLFWTSRGDYRIADGDLADTFNDPLRSLVQEIRSRIESSPGDWQVFPETGTGSRDLVGEPNIPLTAELLKTRIISGLARDGLVNTRDMTLKYLPISREALLMRLSVKVAPTARNGNSRELRFGFIYNYSDNNVYFVGD